MKKCLGESEMGRIKERDTHTDPEKQTQTERMSKKEMHFHTDRNRHTDKLSETDRQREWKSISQRFITGYEIKSNVNRESKLKHSSFGESKPKLEALEGLNRSIGIAWTVNSV